MMTEHLTTLRGEIAAEIARHQHDIERSQDRVAVLLDVCRRLDAAIEAAGTKPPAAAPRTTGEPRNTRRDLRGTMLKAVQDKYARDRQPVPLATLCEGAGVLLGAEPLTLSQGMRAIDPLVRDGSVTRIGNDYAPTAALPQAAPREGLTAAAE